MEMAQLASLHSFAKKLIFFFLHFRVVTRRNFQKVDRYNREGIGKDRISKNKQPNHRKPVSSRPLSYYNQISN